MGKHKKWTLEEKVKKVKEFKKGATISYLCKKYNISGFGTSPIENWFMQLKHEWLCQFDKMTKKQAKKEIEKYVHWYNNERIHKNLGYMSPVQYRCKYSN